MTPQESDVYAFLEVNSINYTCIQHERVSTMEECILPMQILGAVMPRNLLLCPRNKSMYCLLLAHPSSVFKTSQVSRQAGTSRLGFAGEDALDRLMHTHSGALSPFAFIYKSADEVQLLIDKKLLLEEYLIFHPLENTASVKISTADFTGSFLKKCGHQYIEITMEE